MLYVTKSPRNLGRAKNLRLKLKHIVLRGQSVADDPCYLGGAPTNQHAGSAAGGAINQSARGGTVGGGGCSAPRPYSKSVAGKTQL